MFKTITKTVFTSSGKTTKTSEMTQEQEQAFDDAFKEFDKTMDQFDVTMDKLNTAFSKSGNANTTSITVYGDTKADAISKINTHTSLGYELVSLEEDTKLGLWKATLKFKGE